MLEGVAVERGCGRHSKNSYNACKISWGSQAKMVSKCNRIASLVILIYKIFLGEFPQTPLTREGINSLLVPPPQPRAVGTRWIQQCSMAVPLSISRRRSCSVSYTTALKMEGSHCVKKKYFYEYRREIYTKNNLLEQNT